MYTQRPAEFDYHRPATLEEALGLLGAGDGARPLAGGHSLLPLMKLRLVEPAALVDIGRISGLDMIAEDGDGVRIGALATHASVAASELVRARCSVLASTAAGIGDRQVRQRGTIGGSLAHADPAADYPTVVKALAATVVAAGPKGEREIAVDDFFTGIFTTSLEQGELITAVRVPAVGAGSGAAYEKHRHPASGYAVAGVAAVVRVENGKCAEARVVVGGVTGTTEHASAAANAIIGMSPVDEAAIAAAAAKVPEALSGAVGDTYASGEYRVHLATVLARRAIGAALREAQAAPG
jgi:carbon-monoxide dehydrogenase medium subunit